MSKNVDKNKLAFAALAEQWLASISHGVKESTLAHYDYTLQRYLLPVFGTWKVRTLDEQRLEQGMLEVISSKGGSHKPLGGVLCPGVPIHTTPHLQICRAPALDTSGGDSRQAAAV